MRNHWRDAFGSTAMLAVAVCALAWPAPAQPRRPIGKPRTGPIVTGPVTGPIVTGPIVTAPLQPRGEVLAQKAPRVTLSLASPDIQVLKRAPIATQRFAIADPQTKAAIAPTTVLTLPDGRKFEAKNLLRSTQRCRKGLNDLGYSLRTMPDDLVLQKSVINTAKFAQQSAQVKSAGPQLAPQMLRQRFGASIAAPDGQPMLDAGQLAPGNINAIQARNVGKALSFTGSELRLVPLAQLNAQIGTKGVILKQFPKVAGGISPGTPVNKPPKKFHKKQNWGWGWGNDTFEAHVSGNLVADGKADQLANVTDAAIAASNSEYSVSASTQAGGKIIGKDVTLFDATAKFLAPANASKSLNAQLADSGVGHHGFQISTRTCLRVGKSTTPIPKACATACRFTFPSAR